MKMAKPSERDIDAAGNLMSLLHQIDRGDYPNLDEDAGVPDWFDEDNFDHLRAFYDAIKATLNNGPGYPGRVIGGMCYVIMYDKNEIVDPASDTIDLHPKLVKALELAEGAQAAPEDVRNQALEESAKLAIKFTAVPRDVLGPATVNMKTLAAVGEKLAAAIRALRTTSTDSEQGGAA